MSERIEDIARAMVAPGKGILAADESTATIKKRFDSIKTEITADSRRDYREMLFRASDAMKNHISGVILYDETLRQKAKDGTTLVDVIKASGSIPGIKVDTGAKPLAGPTSKIETVTEGLDGLRERLAEYHKIGARFAKWRAVIAIADKCPSYNAINANAHALARYAALCQEAGIVPIVEPEVLMDGEHSTHDIDACYEVTEWVLKETFQQLYYANVKLEGIVLKPNMIVPGQKSPKQASAQEVAEKTIRCLKACVPLDGAGHRVPVGRPVRRGGDRASVADEQDGTAAVGGDVLLWPRAAVGRAEGVGRQGRERRCRPARVLAPRQADRPRRARQMGQEPGEGGVRSGQARRV